MPKRTKRSELLVTAVDRLRAGLDAERCPECGDDPDGDLIHREGCVRIKPSGDPLEYMQYGPPWIALPESPEEPK